MFAKRSGERSLGDQIWSVERWARRIRVGGDEGFPATVRSNARVSATAPTSGISIDNEVFAAAVIRALAWLASGDDETDGSGQQSIGAE